MAEQKDWIYQVRRNFIEVVMKEISSSKDSPEVYLHVYYALAKFGFHIKAEQLGLLEWEDWQKRENIEKLIESIEAFLWKEIR
jgi:hypothetical protein